VTAYEVGSLNRTRFKEALAGMPSAGFACRDMMHAWTPHHQYYLAEDAHGPYIGRTLQCTRCETLRHEKYTVENDTLLKESQSYEYPEGYILTGIPQGQKPRRMIAQELYKRSRA
jgi:hypothetical protein